MATLNNSPLEHPINNQIIQSSYRRRRQLSSNEELVFNTQITDLNDDCIERICGYLGGDDFLNLCESNNQLKTSIRKAFSLRFQNRIIKIYYCGYAFNTGWYSSNMHNCIDCSSIERFLRLFGDQFTKLSIDFRAIPDSKAIIILILKYCMNSLTELKFCRLDTVDLLNCPGSLPALKRLRFVRVSLMTLNFERLFPALEHFELISMSLIQRDTESLRSPTPKLS